MNIKNSILVGVVLLALGIVIFFTKEYMPSTGTVSDSGSGRVAAGYITGHITIGPNCPVESIDHPCTTPPEAYTSRHVIVYEKDQTTIHEQDIITATGTYSIAIGPGDYFLQIAPAGIGPGVKKPVTVTSFETSVVDFDIDTGIR